MNLQVTARGEAVTAVNLQVTARGEAVTALKEHGFKNLMGNDASKQPGYQIQILSSASDSAEAPNSNVKLGLAPVCRIRRILPFYVMKPRFSRSQGSRIPH